MIRFPAQTSHLALILAGALVGSTITLFGGNALRAAASVPTEAPKESVAGGFTVCALPIEDEAPGDIAEFQRPAGEKSP
ncbi:hypothetical protein MCEMSEM23_00372 [Rhabdaerophilaceae bacterium]